MNNDKKPSIELVHLCTVELELAAPLVIGAGPSGNRMIVDVTGMTFSGERLNATLKGRAAADWLTIVGTVATIDVRATIETHDGALIYVQYQGRSDAKDGIGATPIYVAPTFETTDERYLWLNHLQAVGKGDLKTRRYEWYEMH